MAELTPDLARQILARVGESGQPPEVGVEHLNVGNESLLDVLETEYIEPIARTRRGSSFKLVQAYYGGGKTHFLLCVRQKAFSHGMFAALVALSPEETPFDDPLRIYQAVAREIAAPPRDPAQPPERGIDQALRIVLEERFDTMEAQDQQDWVKNTLRRLPVDSPACRSAVVAFALALLDGDIAREELAASWLRGENVTDSEARTIGIREPLNRQTAFRVLRSVCQILQGIGVPGIFLAFDEADRTLSVSSRRKKAIADNLRQLIDHCGQEHLPGLLCLYAVPPEFMREVVTEYPALQQRLEGPSVLSIRSPQAAIIDLEHLDLEPEALLVAIGRRLMDLFAVARGTQWDRRLEEQNLKLLVEQILNTSFEVAHRRAFVKAAVDLLQQQTADPRRLAPSEVESIARRSTELVMLDSGAEDDF